MTTTPSIHSRRKQSGLSLVELMVSYVDARYSFAFEDSREDIEALARYVCAFRVRAERACQARLAELAAAARIVAGGPP